MIINAYHCDDPKILPGEASMYVFCRPPSDWPCSNTISELNNDQITLSTSSKSRIVREMHGVLC